MLARLTASCRTVLATHSFYALLDEPGYHEEGGNRVCPNHGHYPHVGYSDMDPAGSTCWTVIQGAAAGSAADRQDFARRYTPVIRAYLAARWRRQHALFGLPDYPGSSYPRLSPRAEWICPACTGSSRSAT